jgi:hypothetical protein
MYDRKKHGTLLKMGGKCRIRVLSLTTDKQLRRYSRWRKIPMTRIKLMISRLLSLIGPEFIGLAGDSNACFAHLIDLVVI